MMITEVTLRNCAEFAVATENLGARFYGQVAQKFVDKQELGDMFERLSSDKQHHKSQFSQILSGMPQESASAFLAEKGRFLRAASLSKFFSNDWGVLGDIEELQDRASVLRWALGLEEATLMFYRAMEDTLGENPMLSQIIEVERSHIANLMNALLVEESRFCSVDYKGEEPLSKIKGGNGNG
jgi:rubrerythrin